MHELRLLSPLDFELLVRDSLQEEFGIVLEGFGPGRDSGTDFRFHETQMRPSYRSNTTWRAVIAS